MRLDSKSVEPIIEAAKLSPRETEAFRLQCLDLTYRQIAHELKVEPSTASSMLTRITAKIERAWEEAEAALKAKSEEQWDEETEEAASVSTRRGELTFLFRVLRGPRRPNPSPPLVSRTYWQGKRPDGRDIYYAETIRVNAGCPVTLDDFVKPPVASAWEERVTAPFHRKGG